jgi:hypothetical protein
VEGFKLLYEHEFTHAVAVRYCQIGIVSSPPALMTLRIAGIAVTNSSRHFNFKLRPATKRNDGIDLLEGGYLWDQKRSAKGSSTASVIWITARDRFPKGLSKTCQ